MRQSLIALTVLFSFMKADFGLAQPAELMLAARDGDLGRVIVLLDSGVKVDPEGIATPLYFAAQGGYREIAKLLLDNGASPNALSSLGTPLHVAARRGHLEIVENLLRHGADPNLQGGEHKNTPLHEAAEKGVVEIGELLIKHGADVNARNHYFEPPIHLAVEKGRTEFARVLSESGAAPIEVEPISSLLAEADIEKGRARALECSICHQLKIDQQRSGDGPSLWGIVGRPIASLDYPYSEPLLAQTGIWTFERLNTFLADPAGTIPGSGMYRGYVEDKTDRINVIAYLRTLSENPIPLP